MRIANISPEPLTDQLMSDMEARWSAAEVSGEVPAISDLNWFGSLVLTVSNGVTSITAPIEGFSDDGNIEMIGAFDIPFHL